MIVKLWEWAHRWFLAPGQDYRTWIGHSLVVLAGTWLGLALFGSPIVGASLVGFYFWRELLEQVLPKIIARQPVDVIDSWFDVFIPWVLFVLSLGVYGR